jgi:Na+-translocating ferredoxin:NAD+ oxidoreductase subunit E
MIKEEERSMKYFNILKNGIFNENPAFRLVLGMCPTLAVTTSAINGIGMGLSTAAVLIGSNIAVSSLRHVIPPKVRIPSFITIIAGFVTITQLLLKAFLPSLDSALGIFIPLIVVNCVILSRAEAFASKNTLLKSATDGLGMGLGFTLSLLVLGSVRELLGAGSIFGVGVFGESFSPAAMMLTAPGGFLVFGILMALLNKVSSQKITPTGCAGCNGGCQKLSLDKGEGAL